MRELLIYAGLFAAASPAVAQDVIRFWDPKMGEAQGEVTKATYKIVEYDRFAGDTRAGQTAQARDIREIVIDANRKTFEFSGGEDALGKGDFALALERFEKVKRDSRAIDFLKQAAGLNIVKCHMQAGDPAAALAAIKTLRQERPDTYFLRETYEMEYKIHLSRNDAAAVAQVVNSFDEKGRADGMKEWSKTAEIMRSNMLELQKNWREALAIHKKYLTDRDIGEDATLGELRCLRALGDYTSLRSRGEALLASLQGRKGANERIKTAAYNARGEANLNGGKAHEALLDFMQGVVVLNRGSESSREHEAALGGAATSCARVAAAQKDKEKKDLYRSRALELQDELKRGYPGSPFLAEIAKALQESK